MAISLLAFGLLSVPACVTAREGEYVHIPKVGLVAFYPLDGDTQDAGPSGYHGDNHGAVPAEDRFNRSNGAMAFERGDYVGLGDVMNDLEFPFSVAGWVRLPYHYTEPEGVIIATDAPLEGDWSLYSGFWFQTFNGDFGISYGDGLGYGKYDRRTKYAPAHMETSEWMHFAAVVRGPSDITLYKNGIRVDGYYTGDGMGMRHSDAPAVIGRLLDGKLDEIVVYDRELVQSEVTRLYQGR